MQTLSRRFRIARLATAPVLLVSALALTGCLGDSGSSSTSAAAAASGASSPSAPRVVGNAELAVVNGVKLTEASIAPLMAQGLDKANALDRSINRIVAADLAKSKYGDEVREALKNVEIELASNIYISRRMDELLKAVTDDEVKKRYDVLVKDADFNGYQLQFSMFPDLDAARSATADHRANKADARKLFQPVASDKDGNALFIGRNDVPYNLGVVVAKLKKGDYTDPLTVRNGVIVLHVLDIKTQEKPKLEDLKDRIKASIADERLAEQLINERKSADIKLR